MGPSPNYADPVEGEENCLSLFSFVLAIQRSHSLWELGKEPNKEAGNIIALSKKL